MSPAFWQHELARLGGAPLSPDRFTPVVSKLLDKSQRSADPVAASHFARVGGTPMEIQIHRVLIGKIRQENFVAVAVMAAPAVQGTAVIRGAQPYAAWRFFRDAALWQKLVMYLAAPLGLVLILPGALLISALAILHRRLQGIGDYRAVATEPIFRTRFILAATSAATAQHALPVALERALIRFDVPLRVQLEPGRLALELQVRSPAALEAFVREMAPAIADAAR